MTKAKTHVLDMAFPDWLPGVMPERRQAEAVQLDMIFRKATGFAPLVWTGGIVGYGAYDYTYGSGRSGTWMATGFAPRKARLSIHIMPGYADFGEILGRLGTHSKGKSCLYLTRLGAADPDVLAELIIAGLADLRRLWPVRAAP